MISVTENIRKPSKFKYYEYKYLVLHEQLDLVKKQLINFMGKSDAFPVGIVDSIYFDSYDQAMLNQCINGEANKTKIRIRGYGNDSYNQVHLKIKNLSTVNKYKSKIKKISLTQNIFPIWDDISTTKQNDTDFFFIDYMSKNYGLIVPSVRVKYLRYRYRAFDFRMTLDTNIEFFSPANGISKRKDYEKLDYHVLEIKTLEHRPNLPFYGLLALPQISCSKFMLGIQKLNGDF